MTNKKRTEMKRKVNTFIDNNIENFIYCATCKYRYYCLDTLHGSEKRSSDCREQQYKHLKKSKQEAAVDYQVRLELYKNKNIQKKHRYKVYKQQLLNLNFKIFDDFYESTVFYNSEYECCIIVYKFDKKINYVSMFSNDFFEHNERYDELFSFISSSYDKSVKNNIKNKIRRIVNEF